MKKLKELLKETFVWERQFGEKLPTIDSVQKKHNQLKEYKNIEKEVEKDMLSVHIGLGNTMRNILIDLTNQGHGDKEKIPNSKKANQQIEKVRKEFAKLAKLLKVTNFRP
tara:strand:- start:291 stop:620 length:330 start_codon:yes stop_codon:yes gene_type:complete